MNAIHGKPHSSESKDLKFLIVWRTDASHPGLGTNVWPQRTYTTQIQQEPLDLFYH